MKKILFLLFVLLFATTSMWAQTIYQLSPFAGHTSLTVTGINDNGMVVGYSSSSSVTIGFKWTISGGMVAIGTNQFPRAVNNNGMIVGDGPNGASVYWLPNSTIPVAIAAAGTNGGGAFGINDNNIIVGRTGSLTPTRTKQGYLWDYTTNTLTLTGGQEAHDINNSNEVVGHQRFRWTSPGPLTIISGVAADTWGQAFSINNSGVVVGFLGNTGGFLQLTAGGSVTPLGTLAPYLKSYGMSINDNNQIVGDFDYGTAAFIYQAGTMTNLSNYINKPNWVFNYATGINNNGWIIGTGKYNGQNAAFVFDPKPVIPTPITTLGTPTSSACGTLDVPVTVKNFNAVGAISLALNYDPAVLSYQSVTLNSAISNAIPIIPNLGQFRLGYLGSTVTLPEDAVLFTLHFNVLPAATGGNTTPLTWSTVQGECEYAGPGGVPTYVSTFVDKTLTIPTRPVKNTNTGLEYCTIQAAIDGASTGNTITVAAGTYAENIIVNKSLTILGPNASVNPCGGTRVAEAIVVPKTNAVGSGEIFHVTATGVTINGFTIDGDNPLLTSGVTNTTGADLNAAEGVTIYVDNVNNLTVSNNIFQNLSYFGVSLFGATYSAPATSGHIISYNKFQNLGTYNDPAPAATNINFWGGGVLLYNGQYAAINNNCMTNVRIGIQTGNFHALNPGATTYQVFDNNTIQVRRVGIFYNLHTGGGVVPLTLSNNTITALENSNESGWKGIVMASLSDVSGIASGNMIDGAGMTTKPSTGIEVWNVKNDAPAFISGGTIENVDIGVFLNNYEGYSSNAADGAHATLSNIAITPNTNGTGIRLLDSPSSTTHANVQLTIGAAVSVNDGANGLVVENASAKVISPLGNLAFNTQTAKYIKLIGNANDIDATAVLFDTKLGSAMSLAELFVTEDKIDHKIDLLTLGFVTVKANNDYVTVNSFVAPNTAPLIQRGIDAASAGFTVNVAAGTFNEYNINVNKAVIVRGANADLAWGSRLAESKIQDAAGGYTLFNVQSDGVTINGFEITGPYSNNAIHDENHSNVSIIFNNLHDIGNLRGSSSIRAIHYILNTNGGF